MKAVKSNNSNSRRGSSRGGRDNQSIADSSKRRPPRAPPVSLPTTVELRGVQIHFPFKPYACQEDYMGKVLDALHKRENALLESPTGTGKTLCLLCAALAWQREHHKRLNQGRDFVESKTASTDGPSSGGRRVPTIIYASRTHSQLSQVVRELQTTRYRPKHAVLGSREQMCVNPKVKKAGATGADINHGCNSLSKERKCRFRNNLENFSAPSVELGSDTVTSYGVQKTQTQPVRDMEDLVQMGKQHKVCPFFYTRQRVPDAELILVPYNYIFDKDSRNSTLSEVPWKNAVVIFDEAHNLESFASESASFDLTTTDIAGCMGEIQRAVNYLQAFGGVSDGKPSLKIENIAKIKSIFMKLEAYIMNDLNQSKTAYRGEFMMEIFQRGADINHANHELFINEVRKLTDIFLQFGGSSSGAGQSKGVGAPKLDYFVQCVKRVFGEQKEARCFAKAQSYRVHVTNKQRLQAKGPNAGMMGRTVSYWCFAPSEAMRDLAALEVQSILVTSGTLSPLESYALELDLPFPHRLENPHIIPDDQIHVRVIGNGVSNKLLTSSYERRQDAEYYTELGNTLISFAKVVPGGMLVFFPSYGVMETCLEKWGGPASSSRSNDRSGSNSSGFFAARKRKPTGTARYSFPFAPYTFSAVQETMTPWKRLLGSKAVVIEPRSTADLPDAINEFHKYLNMPKSKGVALFGVCRGKISEGIDFAHDMCRAVVITGLPFAPAFDPKVKMKREFLDQNRTSKNQRPSADGGFGGKAAGANLSLSGHEWYSQQAHRAVNQAIGRVIRNKNDYGAVLLLDSRFGQPGNQKGLSKWVRPHILPDEGVGRAIGALAKFYKNAARKAEERDKQNAIQEKQNPVSIILKYEEDEEATPNSDDENVEEITKVAYVRGGNNENTAEEKEKSTSPSKSYVRPESIIGRVDLATKASSFDGIPQRGSKSDVKQVSSSSVSRAPLVAKANPSKAGVSQEKKQSLQPSAAVRFFSKVKQTMTKDEQSIIRKAAVAMKSSQANERSFLDAFCDVVRILLGYDKFEGRSREKKPEMLMLLMELLPPPRRLHSEKRTMEMIFDRSLLQKALREDIDVNDFPRVRQQIIGLMCAAWFSNSKPNLSSQPVLLGQVQKIATSIMSAGKAKRKRIFARFPEVFPVEMHASMSAMFEHLETSLKISALKEKERRQSADSQPQSEHFRSTRKRVLENSSSLPEPSSKAKIDKSAVKVGNPYAKKMAVGSPRSEGLQILGKSGHRPVETHRTSGFVKSVGKTKQVRPYQQDHLSIAVHASETETFTGTLDITKTVKSNVPKDFKCTVCELPCKKPVLAPCNHMACMSCWSRWLKKSKTCPLCRKGTTADALSLVVFRQP